jgi:DNA-binding XRE family transcriptional regulator
MASGANPSSLRERRAQAGLTQAELAARAGVSRQLVAAVEAGQNAPAVDAAIGLARALATTVEELFASPPAAVLPAVGDHLNEGKALRVGRVGDQVVAAELTEHGTAGPTWARPDGVLENTRLRLFPGATVAGIVLAGCDPALGIAEAALQGLGPSSLLALPASTGTALRSLSGGRLHGAVVHGPEPGLPRPPVPVARLHLARWQVGLAAPRKLGTSPLEGLLRDGVWVIQREHDAASQQAFERALAAAGLSGVPGPRASGHIDAARTATVLGCAAVTTESAARAFGLHFQPLEEHIVQVWIDDRWSADVALTPLANLLSSAAFTQRVAQVGGYDLTDCGTVVG